MYRVINKADIDELEKKINELEMKGFKVVQFQCNMRTEQGYVEESYNSYTALMHRPDEKPSAEEKERMMPYLLQSAALCQSSVEQFEAALQACKKQQATGDTVREEKRQHGASQ